MGTDPLACITLDLENDWQFDEPGFDHLTFEYLDEYIAVISDLNIPISIFVVGKTLERYPDAVERLRSNLDVEFHLHSYHHDMSKSVDFEADLSRGIDAFESFFGTTPNGYRAPQGNIESDELAVLDARGFDFDSSIFPSYRPGLFNNLDAPLHPYRLDGLSHLVEIPFAAVPRLRIPVAQSYLKLLGEPFLRYVKWADLPEILVFDSHLQDFFETASHDNLEAPLRWIHKRNLDRSIDIFREMVQHLRTAGYTFTKMSAVHDRVRETV